MALVRRGAGPLTRVNGSTGRHVAHATSLALCLLVPACQQRMASQPSYHPDQASAFFPDGRAARPLMAGTVARGHLRTDRHLFAGKHEQKGPAWLLPLSYLGAASGVTLNVVALAGAQDERADTFPFPITYEVLQHGRDRYMIFCVVCHDTLGTGRGMIVQRGYTPPPSYHIERLQNAPVGHFFEVITKGYGAMPDYAQQIPPRDRWAIIAYIRALQLSQHYPEGQLSDELRREWKEQEKAGREGGGP
jgi:mono/diheme cytochrome c family protein